MVRTTVIACLSLALAVSAAVAQCEDDSQHKTVTIEVSVGGEGERLAVQSVSARPEEAQIFRDAEPSMVCWVVDGLPDDFTVRIQGKSGEESPFSSESFNLSTGGLSISSGKVTGGGDSWRYNVIIDGGPQPYRYDPVIVIGGGGSGGVEGPGGG